MYVLQIISSILLFQILKALLENAFLPHAQMVSALRTIKINALELLSTNVVIVAMILKETL
jgi:hypothetical protein